MRLLDELFRAIHAVLLLPAFQLLRYIFPDLFDSIEGQRGQENDMEGSRSPLVPPRSSPLSHGLDLLMDPSTPLVSPPRIPSNASVESNSQVGGYATAFDLPMPADQDMPTPDGPLAPASTVTPQAESTTPKGAKDGRSVAVRHIYDAEDLSNQGESVSPLPHQPTESASLFGDRSIGGPMGDDDWDWNKTVSDASGALAQRTLGSANRSIGSDLTNFDQNVRREQKSESRNVFFMRHGERQDMAESGWAATSPRPWDPPLSMFGLKQAAQRGADLLEGGVQLHSVVVSPFTRCVQTAAALMRAYGAPPTALTIDARVCEWMSARNLNLVHAQDKVGSTINGEVASWFWGTAAEDGLRQVVSDAWSPEAASQVRIGPMDFPHVHETLAAARSRFQTSLMHLSAEYPGSLLVVTHGDAIGAALEQVQPLATVYQVETAGYVHFERAKDVPGNFTIAGAVGVAWIS